MSANTNPLPDQNLVADTFGWDTAFAIRIDDVNAAIENAKSSPTSFQASGTDSLSGAQFTIIGSFGDWQITTGGSGTLIHMLTPIPELTVQGEGQSFPFQNGQAVIEVELEYIPHTDQPSDPSEGTLHNLMVKTTSGSPELPVVTVNSLTFPDDNFADFQADVSAALGSWFNDNLADFQHVFTTVNLNRTADKGQFQWLLPTYSSYAYIDRGTQDDSLLGVLCMTAGRPADGLSEELSPNALPDGARAGFLISQERFLVDVLLPAMPMAFKGSAVGDYSLSEDKRSLTLNNPVQLQDVQNDGNSYSPQLQSLTVTADAQQLTIDTTTKVEVSWQIWSNCHSVYSYQLVLVNRSDGSQTLKYQQVGTPVQENWTEKGEGVEITDIITGIIAALVVLVVGILTGGAGFVIAGLIVGILMGVGDQIPNMIASVGTDDAPAINMLVFNSTDPITWSDQQDFTLTSAGLNQSLQLGGTPHFTGAIN